MKTAELVRLPGAALRHTTHLFDSVETAPFDTAAYSRMKFGCGESARQLGREMAEAYAAENWHGLSTQRTVVIPAPSTTVPVAATLMSRYFADRLNSLLDDAGLPPVEWSMVHRDMTYNNDYAKLPAAERRAILAADRLYFNLEFMVGKTLVFVDDVRITGTHENKLLHELHARGVANPVMFATFAAYSGDDASIEHRLNHSCVRGGLDVAALSRDEYWSVTTRGLRLLLEAGPDEFADILDTLSQRRREQVFQGAIVKGYAAHLPYRANFNALRASLGE